MFYEGEWVGGERAGVWLAGKKGGERERRGKVTNRRPVEKKTTLAPAPFFLSSHRVRGDMPRLAMMAAMKAALAVLRRVPQSE